MKAFSVDRYGKKNDVRIGEMPDPDVQENDVLVQVHAAAVNLLDSKIRNKTHFSRLLLQHTGPAYLQAVSGLCSRSRAGRVHRLVEEAGTGDCMGRRWTQATAGNGGGLD